MNFVTNNTSMDDDNHTVFKHKQDFKVIMQQ